MKRTVQLHQNECYWLLDEKLTEIVRAKIDASVFSTYPEYAPLLAALAIYAKTPPESICVSAGSDAAISILTELCIHKGMKVVLPVPTFYGYERILARHGLGVIPTYYTEKDGAFEFPLKETLAELKEDTALFLCHPNNPLGCTIPESDLEVLFESAKEKNALVVLDEAYYEFGGTTYADRVLDQPMVVLRTLSKAFGLSGARIGYTISSPSIIKSMQKLQLPWPVSNPSVVAASALLENAELVALRRQLVLSERDKFKDELMKIPGIETFASATNFVLARTDNAREVADKLKEQGILVATTDFMTGYEVARELLASTLRIAVPSPEDRKRVVQAIREITLQMTESVV